MGFWPSIFANSCFTHSQLEQRLIHRNTSVTVINISIPGDIVLPASAVNVFAQCSTLTELYLNTNLSNDADRRLVDILGTMQHDACGGFMCFSSRAAGGKPVAAGTNLMPRVADGGPLDEPTPLGSS